MNRSLQHLRICILFVDGTIVKDQHLVVGIGIDALGKKVVLGLGKAPPRTSRWSAACLSICPSEDWILVNRVCI